MPPAFVVATAAAGFLLWAGPPAAKDAPKATTKATPPPALSAKFSLEMTDALTDDKSEGTLAFLPGGDVCLWVTSPLRQEMRLSARELVIYYPDRDLAMVATISANKAPPMLEPVVAGVADPGSTLPPGSQLLEQRRDNGRLSTRWRVDDGSGRALGELRTVETRDGAESIDLYDRKGVLQRRFSFADRARIGSRSVPRTIDAQYYGTNGAWQRREQWTLRDVAPFDGSRPALYDCARRTPATKVQALPW